LILNCYGVVENRSPQKPGPRQRLSFPAVRHYHSNDPFQIGSIRTWAFGTCFAELTLQRVLLEKLQEKRGLHYFSQSWGSVCTARLLPKPSPNVNRRPLSQIKLRPRPPSMLRIVKNPRMTKNRAGRKTSPSRG